MNHKGGELNHIQGLDMICVCISIGPLPQFYLSIYIFIYLFIYLMCSYWILVEQMLLTIKYLWKANLDLIRENSLPTISSVILKLVPKIKWTIEKGIQFVEEDQIISIFPPWFTDHNNGFTQDKNVENCCFKTELVSILMSFWRTCFVDWRDS